MAGLYGGDVVSGKDEGLRVGTGTEAAPSTDAPVEAETWVMGLAAVVAAVMTLTFDSAGVGVVLLLTLALAPWALVVAGVRVPTWLFVVWCLAPAAWLVGSEGLGGPVFLGILVVARVFSVGSWWPARLATVVAAAALPVLLYVAEAAADDEPIGLADVGGHYFMAGIGVGALFGYLLRRQREMSAELRWSHERLAAAAAAEERRRIAREVHDVVAHSLTVVMLNVTGARKALASQPELAAEALDRAEAVGRESLDGIRRVVGLLRDDGAPAGTETPPQPTAAELPALVDQQRHAGADVTLAVDGDIAALDALTGAAVVRVVQEALTNAQRHAPGAPVELAVDCTVEQVAVTVRNGLASGTPLDARASGRRRLGLVGMRERVEGLGGSFSAGPDERDGWVVRGVIPLSTSSAGQGVGP